MVALEGPVGTAGEGADKACSYLVELSPMPVNLIHATVGLLFLTMWAIIAVILVHKRSVDTRDE